MHYRESLVYILYLDQVFPTFNYNICDGYQEYKTDHEKMQLLEKVCI